MLGCANYIAHVHVLDLLAQDNWLACGCKVTLQGNSNVTVVSDIINHNLELDSKKMRSNLSSESAIWSAIETLKTPISWTATEDHIYGLSQIMVLTQPDLAIEDLWT